MSLSLRAVLVFAFTLAMPGLADTPLTGFPFQNESLSFSVNWPSGISLGQARMQAQRLDSDRWEFELTLDASTPSFTVKDHYRSVATTGLCSVEFQRDSVHGSRRSKEVVTFAPNQPRAHRATAANGGTSDYPVPACAKDALTFLYFTRVEMGQGRVPLPTTISFGGPYTIQLDYKGAEQLGDATTDRLAVSVHGPASNNGFDALFARDAARTPLLIRAPLPLGTFSLALSH